MITLKYDQHTTPRQLLDLVCERFDMGEEKERYRLFIPIYCMHAPAKGKKRAEEPSMKPLDGIFLKPNRSILSYNIESLVRKK